MKFFAKKEFWFHLLLTVLLVLVFGLWAANVLRHNPERSGHPGPPPSQTAEWSTPPPKPHDGPDGKHEGHPGPMRPETSILLLGLLTVVAANIGAWSYYRSERQRKDMEHLRADNLAQQLEALRYQINPHFFMNTLNNIHALVDIDPEKAKESIEEFSKMMRIVLYEGNSPTIPLAQELDYLNHYISLMRLRYPESVKMETFFPQNTAGISVPPLVMASFVENAFKHGISYEHDSYVRVSVSASDGKVIFRCTNSRHPGQAPVQHGIGLQNVRRRLELQYGDRYTLHIDETPGMYDILLIIPAA